MWGIVKTITDRGFGFLSPGDGGRDVFFHEDSLAGVTFDELKPGDVLSFDYEDTPKGRKAVNVWRNGGPRFDQELQVVNTFATPAPALVESVPIASVRSLTDELVRRLRKNPEELYQLHSGMFEELVAEIFKSEGYETEIIGRFNQPDGGVDIVAVRHEIGGMTFRCAVQCKRYAADNSISAEPLRSLRGSMDRYQAPYGVLATTSFFTQPARDEVQAYLWMIGLRDYDNIVKALNRLKLH
jgi:cold shock CspA family protein